MNVVGIIYRRELDVSFALVSNRCEERANINNYILRWYHLGSNDGLATLRDRSSLSSGCLTLQRERLGRACSERALSQPTFFENEHYRMH